MSKYNKDYFNSQISHIQEELSCEITKIIQKYPYVTIVDAKVEMPNIIFHFAIDLSLVQ
jgi:hypothetical protein